MQGPSFHIYACPRSGSTLLSALLSQNDDVFVLNDALLYYQYVFSRPGRLIRKSIGRLAGNYSPVILPDPHRPVSSRKVRNYIRTLRDHYFAPWGRRENFPGTKYYYDILSGLDVSRTFKSEYVNLRDLFDDVYRELLPEHGKKKRILGYKSPVQVMLFDWLLAMYPEHKAVCLIRHPVTNIAAIYKRRRSMNEQKAADASLDFAIRRYMRHTNLILDIAISYPHSLVVRYEDILEDSDAAIRLVLDFLGTKKGGAVDKIDYYIRGDYVGHSIDPERDQKLRGLLTERQVATVERKARRVIDQFYAS